MTLALTALSGCAREANVASYPPTVGEGWVVPANYDWPPRALSRQAVHSSPLRTPDAIAARRPSPVKIAAAAPSSVFAKTLGDVPRPRARNELRSILPGGTDCLARLTERGVHFRTLERELGVKTPIVVAGEIGGVRYYSGANGQLIADCRLILALSLIGPDLSNFGVTEIRFSGAYVYRLSNKGRVSLHAYGLALDMHGFTRLGVHYEVRQDFRKGLGAERSEDAPVANAFARRFRDSGLFHEYLTPDDNADHYDHIHVGVSPLPDEVS